MRMDEMNKDLENRGFKVIRQFVGGINNNCYEFTIERDEHEMSRRFEYPYNSPWRYGDEKQRAFLRDLVADFEKRYPKTMSYAEYYRHYKSMANSLYGARIWTDDELACDPEKVIFNKPATIVFWKDGTKTVVKAQNDEPFDPEKGLAMAIAKKALGNEGNYFNRIKKWTEDVEESYSYDENDVTPQAEKAYKILTDLLNKPRTTHIEKTRAIKEALGCLGEVLNGPKED